MTIMPVGRWHLKRKYSIKQDTVYYLNQRPLNVTVFTARTCGSRNKGWKQWSGSFGIIPNNSLTEILLFILPTISCAGLDILVFKGECFHQRTQHYTDILSSYHWTNKLIDLGFGLTYNAYLIFLSKIPNLFIPQNTAQITVFSLSLVVAPSSWWSPQKILFCFINSLIMLNYCL